MALDLEYFKMCLPVCKRTTHQEISVPCAELQEFLDMFESYEHQIDFLTEMLQRYAEFCPVYHGLGHCVSVGSRRVCEDCWKEKAEKYAEDKLAEKVK